MFTPSRRSPNWRSSSSIKESRSSTDSTMMKLLGCSLAPPNSIPNPRCLIGESRLPSVRTTTCRPMPEREEKAWKAIEKAVELAKTAPANERAYIDALVRRYSKDPEDDRKQLAVNYKDAMKQVMKQYPDDLDAATLYAESLMNLRPWALWTANGEPEEGTLEVLEVIEGVLRRNPDHPGANHYYIHAVEASKNPQRALPSANRLGLLMPGAGHMVHMPSHIYIRTGDHELSATVNETAAAVDRKYIERSGAKGVYPLMYYSHNLHFVSYARMMQGKYEEAMEYSRRLRKNVDGAVDDMPMLAPYRAFDWLVLTRFGKWKEMLAEPAPNEKTAMVHAFYRYCSRRGVCWPQSSRRSKSGTGTDGGRLRHGFPKRRR